MVCSMGETGYRVYLMQMYFIHIVSVGERERELLASCIQREQLRTQAYGMAFVVGGAMHFRCFVVTRRRGRETW